MQRTMAKHYILCCHLLLKCQKEHLVSYLSRSDTPFKFLGPTRHFKFFVTNMVSCQLFVTNSQELLLYEEMRPLNPTFCRRMRMKIVDILLKEVYVTKTIQRSRVLIAKGRELRACGVERLDDCIECLSESISMMVRLIVLLCSSSNSNTSHVHADIHQCLKYSLQLYYFLKERCAIYS